MLAHRKKFIILQSIFLLFLWGLGEWQLAVLLFAGFWLIFIYSWLVIKEVKISLPIPAPICFWTLVLILRTGIASLYFFIIITGDYPTIFTGYDVEKYIHQGLKITVLSDFLIFFAYFKMDSVVCKKFRKHFSILAKHNSGVLFKHGLIFFLLTLLFRLLKVGGVDLVSFGSFFVNMANYGGIIFMMTLVISAIINPQKRKRSLLYIFMVLLAELPFALIGNSKETLIVLFIPIFIYFLFYNNYRAASSRQKVLFAITVVLSAYFVLMVVFPLNQMKRAEYRGGDDATFSFIAEGLNQLLPAVLPLTDEFKAVHQLPDKGIWYAISRSNMIRESGHVYSYVNNIGIYEDQWYYFKLGVMMLVPRILWPEKSITNFGAHTTYLLGRSSSPESSSTSLALGFAGYMYFQGGFLFLTVFSLIHGSLFCISWHVARYFLSTVFMASFLYFYLIKESLKSFEGFADAGLTYYAQYFIIYVSLTYLLNRVSGSSRRIEQKKW